MDALLQRKLERIKLYRTAYELAAIHPDGRRVLIVYSPGRSRNDVWKAVTNANRAKRLVELTGDESIHFGKRVVDGATMGEWKIQFTGRTQRDAYLTGELDYIGDIVV